jgi:hypothetical protein
MSRARKRERTLLGQSSVKAALDGDWDAPTARQEGLPRLVEEAESLVRGVHQHSGDATQEAPLSGAWQDLTQSMTQDLEPDPSGSGQRLRRGTARARLPALGDRDRRHGRKSTAQPLTGDKRHVRTLLGATLVVDAVSACQPVGAGGTRDALASVGGPWPGALPLH